MRRELGRGGRLVSCMFSCSRRPCRAGV